jgi:peptide/nickel transport system substrate-binding protein
MKYSNLYFVCVYHIVLFFSFCRCKNYNEITILQSSLLGSLDPHAVTALNDFRALGNIFDGLVRFNDFKLTKIEPSLAKSWTISDDGLRYRFELRKDVVFHDQTKFNAKSVVVNFERMFQPKDAASLVGVFAKSYFSKIFDAKTSTVNVYAVGEYTVEFKLDSPYSPFLSNLATPSAFIISPKTIEEQKNEIITPAGTGPDKVLPGGCKTCQLALKRFDNTWNGYAKTNFIAFDTSFNTKSTQTRLTGRQVDVVIEPSPDTKKFSINNKNFKMVKQQADSNSNFYFIFNMNVWPCSDINFRQAINLAINKTNLAARLGATPSKGPFASAFLPNMDARKFYNPTLARQIITSVGAYGKTLTLNAPYGGGSGMFDYKIYFPLIQEDLRRVGIYLRVETFEFNNYLNRVNAGLGTDIDIAAMAWTLHNAYALASLVLHTASFPSKKGFNSGYYSNDHVDFLIEQGRNATSVATAQQILAELDYIVFHDYPWVYLLNAIPGYVAHREVQSLHLAAPFSVHVKRAYLG